MVGRLPAPLPSPRRGYQLPTGRTPLHCLPLVPARRVGRPGRPLGVVEAFCQPIERLASLTHHKF